MRSLLLVICLFLCSRILAQQSCPLNSNFFMGNLTHWEAYTGNNKGGNPARLKLFYDSTVAAPTGTIGSSVIYEYQLPSVPGIQVLTTSSTDLYGGFPTIPNINGYQYTNSVLLGSTSITRSNSNGIQGGYVRGISYQITVPTTPVDQPYTMTYAYAMVLENGSHNSNQQPLFSATLISNNNVIQCASPQYFLPTKNNADPRGSGATLDTAAAIASGFKLSPQLSPNPDPNDNSPDAPHLQDVWTKGWTEVTFDLSPYRGQNVTLTFETDNCVPGGHFAYSYIALRKTCDGLNISGPLVACIGSDLTYSIPALTGATYNWTVPTGWTIVSGADSNILKVNVGPNGGTITAHQANSCANLSDAIVVTTTPPTLAGAVGNNNEVCTGNNMNVLNLTGYRGSILTWLSSTDGVNYNAITNTTAQYTAQNLTTTTLFRALVQNGSSCTIDTSGAATIKVDPLSVGGTITPSSMEVCTGQDKDAHLKLIGNTGSVVNWQISTDNVNWTGLNPVITDSGYYIVNPASSAWYRAIVQSGVCPADISSESAVTLLPGLFPKATTDPADTTICYNATAILNAVITRGSNYNWNNTGTLSGGGDGIISSTPYVINASATPLKTTDYILAIFNGGCPNPLVDTFHVNVIPPVIVNAGNDTAVVIGQPLQLTATSSANPAVFDWTPPTGLNNPGIADPIAVFGSGIDSVRYTVKATTPDGCFGTATKLVKIFSTQPDIFVPNAFTPGRASNNLFRPVPVGISSLQFFRVYNRWGQLVYSTSAIGKGWDGTVNGKVQDTGSYVWMVQGTTYTGKTVFRKGTMVLVR